MDSDYTQFAHGLRNEVVEEFLAEWESEGLPELELAS
jgi:hypothetical protein